MNNYLEKDLSTLTILNYIGNIAIEMKENLLDEDLLAFGHNMSKSFKLTQKLNSSFSNQIIEQLIFLLKNYIDGYMLSGSGNGGFLTILLKEDVTRNTVENLLKNLKYNDIQVYNFDLFL